MGFENAAQGIKNLSQLIIDADKDWQVKGISNIKELALGMVQGDILVRGAGGVIIRLPAGVANTVLTSRGLGLVPSWQPGGIYLNRYFPATLRHTYALAIVAASKFYNKNAPMVSPHVEAYDDQPASLVKQVQPVLASAVATAKPAVAQTYNKNAAIVKAYDLQILVGGADKAPGGVDTDETAAAQNVTANDMTLPPQTPLALDAYRFGFVQQFDAIILNIGTAGAGVWTITWKYWDGALWQALAGVTDGTNNFRAAAGLRTVTFTRPGGWALKNINALNLYWISAEVTAYTSRATAPLGTQAWIVRNS